MTKLHQKPTISNQTWNIDNLILTNMQETARTCPVISDLSFNLNWNPFFNEACINRCVLTYKKMNGILPNYINTSPRTWTHKHVSDAHSRNIGYCNLKFIVPPLQIHLRGETHLCGRNCARLEQGIQIYKNWDVLEILQDKIIEICIILSEEKGSLEIQYGNTNLADS